jgi:hypothetical protein
MTICLILFLPAKLSCFFPANFSLFKILGSRFRWISPTGIYTYKYAVLLTLNQGRFFVHFFPRKVIFRGKFRGIS